MQPLIPRAYRFDDGSARGDGAAAVEERTDELPEIFREEGLRQASLDPESPGDFAASRAGAQNDDRHAHIPPLAPKLAKKHFAVFHGKHQIDDHEVGKLDAALREGGSNVTCCDDGVSLLFEQDLQHVPDGRIVIENEDVLLRHACILTARSRFANMRAWPTSELLGSPGMTRHARLAVAAACSLITACAGAKPTPMQVAELSPADLYPFETGNAWSYDVDTGEGTTTLAITRVEAFDGRVAEVRTSRTTVRYEVLPDGIRVLPGNGWLLRAPLREGSSWPGPGGRDARLVSTDLSFRTEAGSFGRCVEVSETGGELELEVRTVYCPGVGPVAVDSTMRSRVSDRAVTVSARLRGFEVSPTADP